MSETKKIGNGWAMTEFWEMKDEIKDELLSKRDLGAVVDGDFVYSKSASVVKKINEIELKYKGGE